MPSHRIFRREQYGLGASAHEDGIVTVPNMSLALISDPHCLPRTDRNIRWRRERPTLQNTTCMPC